MKRVFSFACLGLAVLGLSSCDEERQKIQYTDATGNVQELMVEKTEDPKVVEGVFKFMEQANYKDLPSVSTSFDIKVKMENTSKVTTSFDLGAKLSLHKEQGIAGSFQLSSSNEDLMKYELLYNGSLTTEIPEGDIYLTKKEDKKEEKVKIPASLVIEEIMDKIGGKIEDIVPELPNIDQDTSFTLEDFYKNFTSSKIEISEVTSNSIQIRMGIVLEDIIKLSITKEEYEQIKQMLKIDFMQEFVLFLEIDPLNGFMKQVSFTFENVDMINSLLMLVNKESTESLELLREFKLEMQWKFAYKDVVIPQLTDAEKALYNDFSTLD